MSKIRTLVIVAHMDDEAISCGGLLLNRRPGTCRVVTVFGRKYNYGEGYQHEAEQYKAFAQSIALLGHDSYRYLNFEEGEPQKTGYYAMLKEIENELAMFEPHEVVIPSPTDLNQDHRFLHEICKIALRPANLRRVRTILCWHGVDGGLPEFNYAVPLTPDNEMIKQAAIDCYELESRKSPHPRSPENMHALHRCVGSAMAVESAEPYTLLLQKELQCVFVSPGARDSLVPT